MTKKLDKKQKRVYTALKPKTSTNNQPNRKEVTDDLPNPPGRDH